jgi:hypothetical protein
MSLIAIAFVNAASRTYVAIRTELVIGIVREYEHNLNPRETFFSSSHDYIENFLT